MTFFELMQTGWKLRAPAFATHLPDFTGYLSTSGEIILYGHDYARRIGWECERETTKQFLKNCDAHNSQRMNAVVITTKPEPPAPQVVNTKKRAFRCKACGGLDKITDRHHIVPREVFRGTERAAILGKMTIRLCRPCHVTIHFLPNTQIARMSEDAQLHHIRGALAEECARS